MPPSELPAGPGLRRSTSRPGDDRVDDGSHDREKTKLSIALTWPASRWCGLQMAGAALCTAAHVAALPLSSAAVPWSAVVRCRAAAARQCTAARML